MFKILIPIHGKEPESFDELISSISNQKTESEIQVYFLDDLADSNFLAKIKNLGDNFNLVSNFQSEKSYALKNICNFLDKLKEDSLIGIIDCDDFLWGKDCIKNITSLYELGHDCVWTANRMIGTGINFSAPLNHSSNVYSHPWVSSHFKTFKLSQYKSINKKNFLDSNGDWFKSCYDQALMLPILHNILKSKGSAKYLDKIHYIYNGSLDIDHKSEYRISQLENEKFIRTRGFVE